MSMFDAFYRSAVRDDIPELDKVVKSIAGRLGNSNSDLLISKFQNIIYITANDFIENYLDRLIEREKNKDPHKRFNDLATGVYLYKGAYLMSILQKITSANTPLNMSALDTLDYVAGEIEMFEEENPQLVPPIKLHTAESAPT